jgi:ferredoxin
MPADAVKAFITGADLARLAERWSRTGIVYVPQRRGDTWAAQRLETGAVPEPFFPAWRLPHPLLKSVLFEARLEVARLFAPDADQPAPAPTKRYVFGVKACDLAALPSLDRAFGGPPVSDPWYAAARDNVVIIAGDCTDAAEVCFCLAVGGKPYPEKGYDLNLSPVDGGFRVETGSETGRAIVKENAEFFTTPPETAADVIDLKRHEVEDDVRDSILNQGLAMADPSTLYELVKESGESEVWDKHAHECVECGGCNFVCPTCHCFQLSDHGREELARVRSWDSCQYATFARMAAGHPQARRRQRLRNRYVKKFVFFQDIAELTACTGCGRCVEACLGAIDMREVLRELAREKCVRASSVSA